MELFIQTGQFLGYSDEHSYLVAMVRHLGTGYVSPQYHVLFDDLFKTVFSSGAANALVDSICENLYGTSVRSMLLMNMMLIITLSTSLLLWMKSGWIRKAVNRVK